LKLCISRDNKRGDRETGASRGRETCKRHQDGTEGSLREKRWRNSENEVTTVIVAVGV
jgi:hypothetical protein